MFHLMEQGFTFKKNIDEFYICVFSSQVWLSTAPTQPLTHWYQVRCLFMKPLTVNQGKTIKGHAILHSNRK